MIQSNQIKHIFYENTFLLSVYLLYNRIYIYIYLYICKDVLYKDKTIKGTTIALFMYVSNKCNYVSCFMLPFCSYANFILHSF